jgi:phytoene synthase
MRTDPGLAVLYGQAAHATARGSKSFYFASRLLPAHVARSVHAVYWFCRYTDDLVDESPDEIAEPLLNQWESDVTAALAGETPSHPVLHLFVEAVRQYSIPHEYPLDLIRGMRMDVERTHYRTFDDLRLFCYRVASVVGLMMTHVIGYRDASSRATGTAHAIDLGIAMQLTNILRDIGEDLRRGRVYLPEEDLYRFGVDLRSDPPSDAFRELMQFQIKRAREFYTSGSAGIRLLEPRGGFAVKVAAGVYSDILKEIERANYDVFTRRAVVSTRRKYWLLARGLVA